MKHTIKNLKDVERSVIIAQSAQRYTLYSVNSGHWFVSIPYSIGLTDLSMILPVTEEQKQKIKKDIGWLHLFAHERRENPLKYRQYGLPAALGNAIYRHSQMTKPNITKEWQTHILQEWKIRIWQLEWHEALDRYQKISPSWSDGKLPDPDTFCDFRLHFETWGLNDTQLRKCFDILPLGRDIFDRVLHLRAGKFSPVRSEKHALELVQQGLDAIARFTPLSFDPKAPIRLFSSKDVKLTEVFMAADPATIDLDDAGAELTHPEKANLVCRFLGEMLYRYRSDYVYREYVLWGLCEDPENIDPYAFFVRLSLSGYVAGVDEKGLFLFHDRVDES